VKQPDDITPPFSFRDLVRADLSKGDLLETMDRLRRSSRYLQRVHDCLFEGGKVMDIENDLEQAVNCANGAVYLAEHLYRQACTRKPGDR
jgi:hypothetical protein